MAGGDKAVGGALLVVSVSLFVYYTTWVLVTPFVDASHELQQFFPDRYYAVMVPALLLIVGIAGVGAFVALVMIRSANKAKKKTG